MVEPWRGPAQNHTSFFKFITSRLFLLPVYNQNATGRHWDFWSTSKGGPFFSKLFRLEGTDPLSFGPEFSEILVEWIAPTVTSGTAAPSAMTTGIILGLLSRENQLLTFFSVQDHLVFTKPLTHLLEFFVGICMNCVSSSSTRFVSFFRPARASLDFLCETST